MREEYIFITVVLSIAAAGAILFGTYKYFDIKQTELMIRNGYEWRAQSSGEWVKTSK